MFEKYLKDNTRFIVPSNIKRDVLLYISNNKLILVVITLSKKKHPLTTN